MREVHMFVNGQAMRGGSLSDALAGATFQGPTKTAAKYRFFSVREEFPGLLPVGDGGWNVPGELYSMPYALLREHLLPREPPELELCVIELADGTGALSMRMRSNSMATPDITEIVATGGWREYLAQSHS